MEELKNLKVEFRYEGFVPGVDISERTLGELRELYILMHQAFSTMVNGMIEKINDSWAVFETGRSLGYEEFTKTIQDVIDVPDNASYQDWIEAWYKRINNIVNKAAPNPFLIGDIFLDGDMPVYGVKFKENPNWRMDFVLTEV